MFDSVRAYLRDLTAGPQTKFAANDRRLATAALLVHVVAADGIVKPVERQKLRMILQQHFALDATSAETLIQEASAVDGEAVDLEGFASSLRRAMATEERARVVDLVWELISADGDINEIEESLVGRIAQLLGVPEHRPTPLSVDGQDAGAP